MQSGLSLAGLQLVRPLPFHRTGLPVLPQVSFCKHAITNAPANSRSARFALFLRNGSLPRVEAGSAFASHDFGTCSVFIPIMAGLLADSLQRSLFHRGLRASRCLLARPDCFRLERNLPGGFSFNSPTGVLRLSHGALQQSPRYWLEGSLVTIGLHSLAYFGYQPRLNASLSSAEVLPSC